MGGDVEVRVVGDDALGEAARAAVKDLCDVSFAHRFRDDPDDAFTADDWDHTCGGVRVLLREGDRFLAHAAVVERAVDVGHPGSASAVDGIGEAGVRTLRSGYVEGVAVDPSRQGEGLGTLVMRGVAEVVRAGYEVGVLATSSHHFYERLGWERWRGPTYVLRGEVRERSESEDDGIMVLRLPGRDLDLSVPIACRERSGDDW